MLAIVIELPTEVPPSRRFSSAAVEVTPRVTNCAAASASSNSALPAAVRSYVAAVPDPVNCIPLSAAEVNPATAASSASLACAPRAVNAAEADVAPVPPLAMGTVPPVISCADIDK